MALRCFIADDEAPARLRLKRLLSALPDVAVVGEAADGVSTLEQVSLSQPDVLLLDIQMPRLDGLAVASAVGASDRPGPLIVFVTAYDEHALAAFELSALDYLVKPVNEQRLLAALDKVRKLSSRPSAQELAGLLQKLQPPHSLRRMAVRCGAKFIVFDPTLVYAIFARDHYSAILLPGQELLADDPLEQLARRFDPQQFLRIHRSAIINLLFLRELVHEGDRRYQAVLADPAATRVPVSRDRLPALKAALGLQ
jgi:two-component system, LytTR family, response regulator